MTFEELLKLKEELGSKTYNEAVFGVDTTNRKRKAKTKFVRENKNRPREVSSKKQVPLLGKPSGSKKAAATQARDPRFDEKCGEFDKDEFKTNYSFVNDIRDNELTELKKQLKKLGKGELEEKRKIKLLIQRMENQNREEQKLQARKKARAEDKQKNRTAIQNEKRPFFASKGRLKSPDQQNIVLQFSAYTFFVVFGTIVSGLGFFLFCR